jgi:hypothetical protein
MTDLIFKPVVHICLKQRLAHDLCFAAFVNRKVQCSFPRRIRLQIDVCAVCNQK